MPMLTGLVTDEGILMAYFVKENLDRLDLSEIRSANSQFTGGKQE